MRARRLTLLCLLALTACAPGAPTESFAAAGCTSRDTGEWRTRNERGACIVRSPKTRDSHGNSHGGNCVVYSTNTVHEKMQSVSCSKTRWVRR